MKNIIYTLNLLVLITLFNSCGTSSSTQEGDSVINTQTIQVINCNGSGNGLNDCINYTCIKANDALISNTNNTLLEIIHTSSNDKKVCVKSTNPAGSAKILR